MRKNGAASPEPSGEQQRPARKHHQDCRGGSPHGLTKEQTDEPFSAKELTDKIEEIMKEKVQTETQPATRIREKIEKAGKTEIQTYSAYAILKLEKNADFFGIFRKLYFDKNVLYCDATKGEKDIFLLIQSHSLEGCRDICDNQIRKIEGVKEVEYLEVSNPILDDSLKNILNVFSIESTGHQAREFSNVVCSYILVEIARENLDSIYPTLYFNDNVVYCDYTENCLVLLAQGTQFSEIDNLIKNKIVPLEGVLKVKEYPIITIFEM